MKNRIIFRGLSYLGCGNPNRDRSGYPKTYNLGGKEFIRISAQCLKSSICKVNGYGLHAFDLGSNAMTQIYAQDRPNRGGDGRPILNNPNVFLFGRMIPSGSQYNENSWRSVLNTTGAFGLTGKIAMDEFTLMSLRENREEDNGGATHLNVKWFASDVLLFFEVSIELSTWQRNCDENNIPFDHQIISREISKIVGNIIRHKPYSYSDALNNGGYSTILLSSEYTNEHYSIFNEIFNSVKNGCNSQDDIFKIIIGKGPDLIWVDRNYKDMDLYTGIQQIEDFSIACGRLISNE